MSRSKTPDPENAAARARCLAALNMEEIEGNPLTAEEVAMFEMFEREGWTLEKRRVTIDDYVAVARGARAVAVADMPDELGALPDKGLEEHFRGR